MKQMKVVAPVQVCKNHRGQVHHGGDQLVCNFPYQAAGWGQMAAVCVGSCET